MPSAVLMNALKQIRTRDLASWVCFVFAVFLFMPTVAEASTLGDVICNIRNSGSGVPGLLSAIAYIIGAILILRGALLLKKATDSGGQTSPVGGIAMAVSGSAIILLPALGGWLQSSLFAGTVTGAGGTTGCTAGTVQAATGLDQMMKQFVSNIYDPIFSLIGVLAFIVGLVFIIKGILRMSKTGTDPRAASPKDVIIYLIIGTVLVSLSTVLPMMLQTVLGTGTANNADSFKSIIKWSNLTTGTTDKMDETVVAILRFVQIVGLIAFFRGWLIIKTAVEGGQATIPQGATHIIGGAMAINIGDMLSIFNKTFGTDVINAGP